MAFDKTIPVATNDHDADLTKMLANNVALWPYTTAGDIAVAAGATANLTRLAVGTNGQVLGSNGTAPGWVTPTTVATDTLWDAAGDLAVGTGANTAGRLAKGADGTVLKMVAGAVAWGAVSGTGDVVGPESAIADNVATYDGTTGKLIKDSGITSASLYRAGGTDVAVADGGTGLSTFAAGSAVVANSANTLSAVTSTSDTKVLTNTAGTISWETATTGGASFWTQTTGTFTATPASTSTITMTTDLTATIKINYPLRYVIGGITYIGIVTAITSNLLTVAGAPLGGDITALYYGNPERVKISEYAINGYFADAANTTLLQTDSLYDGIWHMAKAYLVKISHIVGTDDSGANQPHVTVSVNGQAVGTDNTNAGLAVAETFTHTVVGINTSNYDINPGEVIEVVTDAAGSNDDAQNITVACTWVLE